MVETNHLGKPTPAESSNGHKSESGLVEQAIQAIAIALNEPKASLTSAMRESKQMQQHLSDFLTAHRKGDLAEISLFTDMMGRRIKAMRKVEHKLAGKQCPKMGCDCRRVPAFLQRKSVKTEVKCQTRGCGNWTEVFPGMSAWCKKCKQPIPKHDFAAWALVHGSMEKRGNGAMHIPVLALPAEQDLITDDEAMDLGSMSLVEQFLHAEEEMVEAEMVAEAEQSGEVELEN